MKARILKWGNSLAVRIPKTFADESGLRYGAAVELSHDAGRLIIQPVPEEGLTLDELLKGVMDENLHCEWDTGTAVGREVW